jgi:hypothetical protein
MEATDLRDEAQQNLDAARLTMLWLLFFTFALALGYPTLKRYDPRTLGDDQNSYYRMVAGTDIPDDIPFGYRLLVPYVAKPFYWLARGRTGTWNPVWFGMLIANSLFCATFSILQLLMGFRILRNLPLALLGCTVTLLNYAVPNLWLSGYVDASEACLLMAVTLAMFTGRWWPLPFIGIIGGIAKQTFLPFATVFALVWWIYSGKSKSTYGQLLCIAGMALTSFASIIIAFRIVDGNYMMPWSMASQWWRYGTLTSNLLTTLTDHGFVYPFIWLLPLGIWRFNRFPKPWVMATIVTGIFAFGFAAYTPLNGTVNRPMFNVIAPLFGLSTACFIAVSGTRARSHKSTK